MLAISHLRIASIYGPSTFGGKAGLGYVSGRLFVFAGASRKNGYFRVGGDTARSENSSLNGSMSAGRRLCTR